MYKGKEEKETISLKSIILFVGFIIALTIYCKLSIPSDSYQKEREQREIEHNFYLKNSQHEK